MNRRRLLPIALAIAAAGAIAWLVHLAWTIAPTPPPPVAAEAESDDDALLGRVLDPEGKPVAGASVIARPSRPRRGAADGGAVRRTTDDQGRFAFGALPPGAWELDAEAKGLHNPGPADRRALRVRLDDASAVEVDLQLRRPARLRGRVMRGESGVVGARLVADVTFVPSLAGSIGGFELELDTSGAGGAFDVEVPAGRLRLRADDGADRAASDELVLADGGERDGVVLQLASAKAATVQGTVRDGQGQPLQALVELHPVSGRPQAQRTDADGSFRFAQVPAGLVRLRARAEGFGMHERDLQLQPGEVAVADIVLGGGGALRGVVVDLDGQPVAEATVVLDRGAERTQLRSDSEGRFEVTRPELLGPRTTVRAVSLAHADSPAVEALGGSEVRLVLGRGGELAGRVVDANGGAVAGAVVSVQGWEPVDPDPFAPSMVTPVRPPPEASEFRLGPLRPGRYRLRGEAPGRGAAVVTDLWVRSGEAHEGVELRLGAGGVVRGQIRNEQGEPVGEARVLVWEPGSALPPKMGVSDGDGSYRLEGVTPGRLSLRAQHPMYVTALESGVEVRDGAEVVRDIVVRKRTAGERFSFQGIGATLGEQDGAIVVRGLMADAPARAAGMREGDRIVAVDGNATRGMGLPSVVERIRGEPGSSVTVDVDRPGYGRIVLTIARSQVTVRERGE